MYPKNAASPEPIAIGAVVNIATGAVETTGVTVRIKPIGVAEADGGGTTAYSTDNIIFYTPTQAETNYTSFILIAKKTGCVPVSINIVTTASATPGTVNVAAINSNTTAASNLALSAGAIVTCTASGTPTATSIPTSACSPSGGTLNQFKGRIVIFLRDTTTAALRGQATDITSSSASATPTFTVTSLTTAPVSGDTFVIV